MIQISVIVPVYNVEKYLSRCLDSIYSQTFEDFEVIIVNDGSTDSSLSIAEEYARRYCEKTKIVTQKNGGLSAARNTGLKIARGEYIQFVDSDDTINKNMLEAMYGMAQKNNSDLVMCAIHSVDEDGKELKIEKEDVIREGEICSLRDKKELMLCLNAVWSKLFRRSIVSENGLAFTEGVWYEDLRFTRKYLYYAENVVYSDEVLYNYLVRQGSIMNSMADPRNMQIVDAFAEVIDFYRSVNEYENYEREIEFFAIRHIYIAGAVRFCRAGELKMAKKMHSEFEELFPSFGKNEYIGKLPRNEKIVYLLFKLKLRIMVKWLFDIKGGH